MRCWHRERCLSRERMLRVVEFLRRRGRRIVFTNGCFDLLHAGHVHMLTQARRMGDLLIVGLNSDVSIRWIKGPSRPINRQAHRAAVLAALACVDYVALFDEDTPMELLAAIRPDVLVKGGDYPPDGVFGRAFVQSDGGDVQTVPPVPGISTTALLATARVAHEVVSESPTAVPGAMVTGRDERSS